MIVITYALTLSHVSDYSYMGCLMLSMFLKHLAMAPCLLIFYLKRYPFLPTCISCSAFTMPLVTLSFIYCTQVAQLKLG